MFGSVRLCSGWVEVGMGRSLVLLWRSDGITMWVRWGVGRSERGDTRRPLPSYPPPKSVIPALAAGVSTRAGPTPRSGGSVASNLIWGPYGGRQRHSAPSGPANGRWWAARSAGAANGVGFGPQIKFGATEPGAGVGGRSGRLERWRRDTRGKRGYDGRGRGNDGKGCGVWRWGGVRRRGQGGVRGRRRGGR